MQSLSEMIFYLFSFILMYVQVFFFVTFLDKRKSNSQAKTAAPSSDILPSVTVIIPCWNEERTVGKTIDSLLRVNYPSDKLDIFVVNDGSSDKTAEIINSYSDSRISVFHKENGGKHSALNCALEKNFSDLVACLDADTTVAPDALIKMVTLLKEDSAVMAVVPAVIVDNPKNFIQKIQYIEYFLSVFIRQVLGKLNSMHVTPGTLSLYRKEVFEKIGGFKKAYNTEDGEIALRMQKNFMKISYCADAYVYTTPPETVRKLFKQRLRWFYGYFKNLVDYRKMIMNPRFGALGLITLPTSIISVFAVIFVCLTLVYNLSFAIYHKIVEASVVGVGEMVSAASFQFDWFYLNTKTLIFVTFILYAFSFMSMIVGRYIIEKKVKLSWSMVSMTLVYSVTAPLWLLNAVYKVIVPGSITWR